MTLEGRLCVPVRLCDIRLDVRMRAAIQASKRWPVETPELVKVAMFPSERTYYVSESARPLIERYAA